MFAHHCVGMFKIASLRVSFPIQSLQENGDIQECDSMAGCWYVDPSSKRSWGLGNADRLDHMSLSEYDLGS